MQEVNKVVLRVFTKLKSKCVAIVTALLIFTSPVFANDLASDFAQFQTQAQTLEEAAKTAFTTASTHPFAPPEAFDLAGGFARGVIDFSDLASSLVAQLVAKNGPKDLTCIYRGMAEDAKLRLAALQRAKNAGEQAGMLKDMMALFADAIAVTPDNKSALTNHHDEGTGQCAYAQDQKIENLR